jgi:DNA-directed RNA polymerase subunit RPC12/RpoP
MSRMAKCAKCGRESQDLEMVLMIGPQGYRRYPVCGACKAELEKKQAARKATAGASRNG